MFNWYAQVLVFPHQNNTRILWNRSPGKCRIHILVTLPVTIWQNECVEIMLHILRQSPKTLPVGWSQCTTCRSVYEIFYSCTLGCRKSRVKMHPYRFQHETISTLENGKDSQVLKITPLFLLLMRWCPTGLWRVGIILHSRFTRKRLH